ncbi:hypothetical protein PanWU01x14_040120 [Parasponia andersonii]|uniref:Uncharacterized protein n=1 Tax=Parasponia andersonii TaxID=3476 RepID=A0A2P5DR42_PARAD|nr:hypothetical protein PanWU01x14_040120 [Parasponia andersonii]
MAVHYEKKQENKKRREFPKRGAYGSDRSRGFLLAKLILLLVEESERFLYDIGGPLLGGYEELKSILYDIGGPLYDIGGPLLGG